MMEYVRVMSLHTPNTNTSFTLSKFEKALLKEGQRKREAGREREREKGEEEERERKRERGREGEKPALHKEVEMFLDIASVIDAADECDTEVSDFLSLLRSGEACHGVMHDLADAKEDVYDQLILHDIREFGEIAKDRFVDFDLGSASQSVEEREEVLHRTQANEVVMRQQMLHHRMKKRLMREREREREKKKIG
jgi:hypothetical protein